MNKLISILLLLAGSAGSAGAQQSGLTGPWTDLLSTDKPAGTISSSLLKNFSLTNGTTADVLPTVTASGYVSELVLFTNQYSIEIIVTVDGEGTPSIDMNLADLLGDDYMDTQPAFANNWISGDNSGAGTLGGAFRLPIPFSSSIHIQMKNNSGSTALITGYVVTHTGVPNTWPYTQHLFAVHTTATGIAANADSVMINVTPGKKWRLAGFGWLYDSVPGSVSPAHYALEGAFKTYIDSGTATITSSGTEDMFGLGWYFNNGASFGNTSTSIIAPLGGDMSCTIGCLNTGPVTWGAQRFFIKDPITGNSSLKMSWACGNIPGSGLSFTGTCKMSTTVFYYREN